MANSLQNNHVAMRPCKYDTTITKNASVHVSMSLLYIYLGVLLVERVGYDFSVSLCASLSTSFHYSDDLRCLLYLFSFGHVFFRANANCRLYQTADSTETPLLAQVLSLLSFSFAFFTSAFSYRSITCMARLSKKKNIYIYIKEPSNLSSISFHQFHRVVSNNNYDYSVYIKDSDVHENI